MTEESLKINLISHSNITLIFFKCNSLRSNKFMTRDSYQQFWYTGVVLITRPDHYFTVSVNPKTFLGF